MNNVAKNEQKANEIHEQVAKTTNDEDILNRQVVAATDNETRSLESARKNHEGTIDGLNKQREGLKEPTEPKKTADDADEAVKKEYADKKSQYEADMKAYKEQSAILDDAFKAENKRYEQELKDIEKKAKDDKNQAKADLEQAQIQLSKLLAQKDSNNAEINDLNRKISDL